MNPEGIGRTYRGGPYQVSREELRRFAASIGETDPRCHDVAAAQAAGYPDLLATPTYAYALTTRVADQVLRDPLLGVVYEQAVHGEQEFSYHRPIVAGEQVTVECTITDIQRKGRNEVLACRYLLTGADGEHLIATREVIVTRGTAK